MFGVLVLSVAVEQHDQYTILCMYVQYVGDVVCMCRKNIWAARGLFAEEECQHKVAAIDGKLQIN